MTEKRITACPPEDQMWSLLQGHLEADDAEAMRVHLDGCVSCQAVVGALLGTSRPEPSAPAPDAPGTVIAQRYEVLAPLGAGAMGTVVRARDRQLERDVALKMLHAGGDAHPAASGRVLRESKAMASLRHPNVVTVFDAFEDGGVVIVVMELLGGGSLRDGARQRRPWPQVCRQLLEAGEGLHAAHEAGWVHRDFKPDNVLLDEAERAHVADFGLARALCDPGRGDEFITLDGSMDPTQTQTGRQLGTPLYMAPEQFQGATVDARADVYAFCVTAVELLCGRRPFDAVTLGALRAAKQNGQPPSVPRGHAPRAVREVLARGLSVEPENRPSLRAVLTVLRTALARRSRRPVVALLGGSVAVAAALGVASSGGDGPCDRGFGSVWSPADALAVRATWAGSADAEVAELADDALVAFAQAHETSWSQACSRPVGPSRTMLVDCLAAQQAWVELDVALLVEGVLPPQAMIDATPAPLACEDPAGVVVRPVPDADALARWRRLRVGAARARNARLSGDAARAGAEATALRTELDVDADAWFVADLEATLGEVAHVRDDHAAERQHLETAARAASVSGHFGALVASRLQLSTLALNVDGDLEAAQRELAAAQAGLARLVGTRSALPLACMAGQAEASLSEARGDFETAAQQRVALVARARADAPAHVANALMELGRLRVSMGQHRDGVALLEQALDELGPPTRETADARGVVYRNLTEAALRADDLDAALAYLQRRRALVEGMADWAHRVLPMWLDELQVRILRGEYDRAATSLERLQLHLERHPDIEPSYRRRALRFGVEIAQSREDFEACDGQARALLTDPTFDVHSLDGVNTRLIRVSCLIELGRVDRALESADTAIRSARRRADTPTLLALALAARAEVYVARGQGRNAVADAEEALQAIPAADPWSMRPYVDSVACRARYAAGEIDTAAKMAPRVVASLDGSEREAFEAWAREVGLPLR
ncbi:MAG: protein kinase [Myxococcota bacterium]